MYCEMFECGIFSHDLYLLSRYMSALLFLLHKRFPLHLNHRKHYEGFISTEL